MVKKIINTTLVLILFGCSTLLAQPGGGGGGQGQGGPPGTGAPVDSGIAGLVMVAAIYAYRELKQQK